MHGIIPRLATKIITNDRDIFPAIAIIGPRQSGKSTLVKNIGKNLKNFLYLDLEKNDDLQKLDTPELFFEANKDKIICLDEIQNKPNIFSCLRSVIDENRINGRFLFLGSASGSLLKQTAETLAGRISFVELSPFLVEEAKLLKKFDLPTHWLRGGYPQSYLAKNNQAAFRWLNAFIQTYIEKDILLLNNNLKLSSTRLKKLLSMCAHNQGQILNISKLGQSLDINYKTLKNYLEILEESFVLRTLHPYSGNLKKRLIKSPKLYIRDSGILHSILKINDFNDLLGNLIIGRSWEGFALENIISTLDTLGQDCLYSFYRTSNGAEIDLILEKGNKKIAIEFKSSMAPKPSVGFYKSMEDLRIKEGWIIAPINIEEKYEIKKGIFVASISKFLQTILK